MMDNNNSNLWNFSMDPRVFAKWGKYIRKGFGTVNNKEIRDSTMGMFNNKKCSSLIRLNEDKFCRPVVKFPSDGFSPDWFYFNGLDYFSSKLADALAQPPELIQYFPVYLDCQGEAALAQNYKVARILAHQSAMDLQRSEYKFDFRTGEDGKTMFFHLGFVRKFVLHESFEPKYEVFRVDEAPVVRILATDALAERVLKAGCTGVQFKHLDTPDFPGGTPVTIRTARGVKVIT
jgi:hypothetical protein